MGTRYIPNLTTGDLEVTGALQMSGEVGVGGDVQVGGKLTTEDGLDLKKFSTAAQAVTVNHYAAQGTADEPADTATGIISETKFYGRIDDAEVEAAAIEVRQADEGEAFSFIIRTNNFDEEQNSILQISGGEMLFEGVGVQLASDDVGVQLGFADSKVAFFGATPITEPAITGWAEKTDTQKVDALKDAMVALGLISVT
jgi:hypothetical protein